MFDSPLRYPGGKRKLANFIRLVFRANNLLDGEYAEVYAGGAAVALSLVYGEHARRVHINDLDRGVHAFWDAALHRTDELCKVIRETKVRMETWEKQRAVYASDEPDPLELAFATFFLNRTNRSGIITGGVIGGKKQAGEWKIGARYNKDDLIKRIEKVGRYSGRIRLYNYDATEFIKKVVPTLPERSLTYLDPPYYVKGQQMLYANYYLEGDHAEIARLVMALERNWLVTYDDVDEIQALYEGAEVVPYGISYSAQDRYRGKEVAFFSDGIKVPDVHDPAKVKARDVRQLSLEEAL